MIITHKIDIELNKPGIPLRVDAVQGDAYTRHIQFGLYADGQAWEIPAEAQVLIRYAKPDGTGGEYDTLPDGSAAYEIVGNILTVVLAPQVLSRSGPVRLNVCLIRDTMEINTFPVTVNIHANVGEQITASEDYYRVSGFVPMPGTAEAGTYIRVKTVDEHGVVRKTETAGIGDAVVIVPTNQVVGGTEYEGNLLRRSYHLGSRVVLDGNDGYRINRIGVRAAAGAVVRFALYGLSWTDEENGVMTQLAVLGDAVADEETQVAALTFDAPYEVRQDNTILLAFAREAVIQCQTLGGGLNVTGVEQFADGDYFENENGAEIPFFNGKTTENGVPWYSIHIREIDLFREVTLEDYIRETALQLAQIGKDLGDVLPTATVLDNGKVLSVVDGAAAWAEPSGGVSSWNDLTDKPFYEEGSMEVIFPEEEISFACNEAFGLYCAGDVKTFSLAVGETYTVLWDEKEYVCTAQDASALNGGAEMIAIGDGTAFGMSGNQEPFIIATTEDAMAFFAADPNDTSASHKICVSQGAVTIKTLDEKYLPMEAIDARIEEYINSALEGDY